MLPGCLWSNRRLISCLNHMYRVSCSMERTSFHRTIGETFILLRIDADKQRQRGGEESLRGRTSSRVVESLQTGKRLLARSVECLHIIHTPLGTRGKASHREGAL